jgi:outer membrane protein W
MKNNFKKLAVIAGIFALSQNVNAQTEKGFYASFNAGYGANIGGTTNLAEQFELYNSQELPGGNESIEIKKVGLGKGLNIGIAAGYMFNKNIGAELGFGYVMGSKTSFTQTQLDGTASSTDIKGRMLQIKPTLVLTAGYSKINPYTKFGLVIGKAKAEGEFNDNTSGSIVNIVTEFDGGMSLGFQGGFGINYALTSKLAFFGEIMYTGISFSPETAKMTSATVDGENVLPFLDASESQTEFVDEFITGAPFNSNAPTKQPKIDMPFSNLGLNIGLKYGF